MAKRAMRAVTIGDLKDALREAMSRMAVSDLLHLEAGLLALHSEVIGDGGFAGELLETATRCIEGYAIKRMQEQGR